MPVWTASRRTSPITASAAAMRVSARRIALPTAIRAFSSAPANSRTRPASPAAADSSPSSQSRSVRTFSARPASWLASYSSSSASRFASQRR